MARFFEYSRLVRLSNLDSRYRTSKDGSRVFWTTSMTSTEQAAVARSPFVIVYEKVFTGPKIDPKCAFYSNNEIAFPYVQTQCACSGCSWLKKVFEFWIVMVDQMEIYVDSPGMEDLNFEQFLTMLAVGAKNG